jgi:O-antigen/teichoic acid export membrane protein
MIQNLTLFGRNVSWLTTAELVKLVCWWAMLVVIGKLLGVEAVGYFGLAIALSSPVRQFANLGLRSAIATDVAEQYSFDLYYALRILTNCGFMLVVLTVAIALGYSRESLEVIAVYSVYKMIQAQSGVCHGLFQKHQRLDIIAKSILFRSIFNVVLLSSLIAITNELIWGVFGLVVSELFVFLFYDRVNMKIFLLEEHKNEQNTKLEKNSNRTLIFILVHDGRKLWRLVIDAFPLGLVGLLGSLQLNLPRLVVESALGVTALGYFTAISAFYSAFTQVMDSMGHSASARLARDFQNDRRGEYLALLGLIGLLACLAGLVATVIAFTIGGELLALLFTADYATYETLFGLVMVAASLRLVANLWQVGVLATWRFWLHGSIHILVAAATAIAAVVLIPQYGLMGAGYSLIISSAIHLVGVILVVGYLVRRLTRPCQE